MRTFLNQISGQAENRFYGHLHILAKYCGLTDVPFLNGYLQHGWNATDGFGNYLGKKRNADKFVWSKRCENLIKPYKENVYSIGAPWLYLEDIFPPKQNIEKKGVVAYPAHSSSWSKMGDTHQENAEYLFQKYNKVTVVLHKYDYSNPKIKESYEKIGHSTFCHGSGTPWENNFDPLFLKNQRDFLTQFDLIVSNTMQTAMLYATSLGLAAEIGGPIDYSITEVNDKISQVGDGKTNWNQNILQNKNLWIEELGLESKKNITDLKAILGWDKPKVKYFYIKNRIKDLAFGSNLKISANIFKSMIKIND